MTTNSINELDVISWIEKSVENERFKNFEIALSGKTEKGEGYLGEIVFATVSGTTNDNKEKVLDIVVKHSKNNEHLRKVTSVITAFRKEMLIYDKVLPAFKNFQVEKNIENPFDSTPTCYKTLLFDNMEIIVLENLRKIGYELYDSKKPLNIHHLKLVLAEYGKLHALSFALRDQRKEEFDSLLDDYDFLKSTFAKEGKESVFDRSAKELSIMLKERNETVLDEKLGSVMVKDTRQLINDLFAIEEPQSVIIHGDCWNNNFLFKYQDDVTTAPSKVKILDWQLSALRSPVFDLSYFIYVNSSQKELDRFDELMDTYYNSFSDFLKRLGSNPEQLFTFDDLRRHWKKYSLFGFLFAPVVLKFALCKKEEAPALEDLKEGQEIGSLMTIVVSDKDAYYERLRAMTSHFFEYEF